MIFPYCKIYNNSKKVSYDKNPILEHLLADRRSAASNVCPAYRYAFDKLKKRSLIWTLLTQIHHLKN